MAGADTKQIIFDTATALFAEEGYDKITMRRIAAAVGIKPASIYNHFSSKEEILNAIFDECGQIMRRYEPDIDDLMRQVGIEPPHALLYKTLIVYPENEAPFFNLAMNIVNSLHRSNERARALTRYLLSQPDRFDRPLVEEMLRQDLIEPIDVDTFIEVIVNFCYGSAVRFYENIRTQTPDYTRALSMIFSLVKEKKS